MSAVNLRKPTQCHARVRDQLVSNHANRGYEDNYEASSREGPPLYCGSPTLQRGTARCRGTNVGPGEEGNMACGLTEKIFGRVSYHNW